MVMNVSIRLKKTHEAAALPTANNKELGTGDTGFDLVAVDNITIPHGTSKVIPVRLTVADITPGYWIKIEPRSGLGFKKSLQPHLGVIDNGYRGDLSVKMYNFHDSIDAIIEKGEKIAQLVVYELIQPIFEFSDEVSESARGEKGFGSSDKQFPPGGAQDISYSESACDNTSSISAGNLRVTQEDDNWYYDNEFSVSGMIKAPKVDEGSPDYIPSPSPQPKE